MNEYETIAAIASRFRRSPEQLNAPFESDAEFIRVGGAVWGLTVDEFSEKEDLFTSADPDLLGANLAVATLSDLLAAGVEPRFMLHSISLPADVSADFVSALCGGLSRILDSAGCAEVAPAQRTAGEWRYAGFAMGPLAARTPLKRVLPAVEQDLWISGALGHMNAAALTGAPTPALELRVNAAALAREAAVAGTDTSGGLADALWMMRRASPGMRLEVELPAIPYSEGVKQACAAIGAPPESALFGGAGEYELLFSFPAGDGGTLAAKCARAGLTRIGRAFPSNEAGVFFAAADARALPMTCPPPCPREARDAGQHALAAVAEAKRLLAGREGK